MSREDDAKIAERLFGWSRRQYGLTVAFASPEGHAQIERVGYTAMSERPTSGNEENALHYSTDPAASKQLREKLAEKWDWLLGRGGNASDKPFGFALFEKGALDRDEDPEPIFINEADTEEQAIVACALVMLEKQS